MLPAFLQDK